MENISREFYRKNSRISQDSISPNYFQFLQDILIKDKSVNDFQPICDVLYFHDLFSKHLEESHIGKLHDDLYVDFSSILSFLNKPDIVQNIEISKSKSDNSEKSDNSLYIRLDDHIERFKKWRETIGLTRQETISDLYLNMIFEMFYCWDWFLLTTMQIESVDDFPKEIAKMIEQYSRQPSYQTAQADYYLNGLEDAKKMHEILRASDNFLNDVPITGLMNRFGKIISYKNNQNVYLQFCTFIDSAAQSNQSVLFKYITIQGINMSSGERALQNLYSWLNLPPKFDKYIEGRSIPINESILLLIDEIDLYMHPDWQRQAINNLISELTHQYRGNKIQIILSTHSPLVLSDIPKQNTIYLESEDNKLCIVDNATRPQTFGANIHTLLNDSFYVTSTMGAFAQKKIQEIYNDLSQLHKALSRPSEESNIEELQTKCKDHNFLIELIGEPLIRNKLHILYEECFPNNDESSKVIRRLEKTISKLRSERTLDEDQLSKVKKDLQHALKILNEKSASKE